ncbi:MAG: hypothetical protein J6Y20_14515 [Lachnospiraceae bacterium]|nr:hypothetical protein [Lachnospiraceae bacterium]
MSISYDLFTGAFLSKITEFEFIQLPDEDRTWMVDGYMKRAISAFRKNCKYDLINTGDDELREFAVDVNEGDVDELVDIISEGMVVQWLKPYVYKQELLENVLNTRDFTTYSPAELLMRVGNAYAKAQKDYTQMIREYSYNHGDLSDLHL